MNKTLIALVLFATFITPHLTAQASLTEGNTMASGDAHAASTPALKSNEPGRWYFRIGAAGVIFHPDARVVAGGVGVPGASATVGNNATVLFDGGYYFSKHLAASVMAGIPPKAKLSGAGTLSPYGELGSLWYGPATLSAHYHFLNMGRLQPYIGPGLAYVVIMRKHTAALSNLQVHNNFAPVLQVGADYMFNRRWGTYIDCKQIWLSVDAHGKIEGVVPAYARVKLYPSVVQAGVIYRF